MHEVVLNILGGLAEFLVNVAPELFFSEETKGRELALWAGLFLAMEACAAAFSSMVLAIAGITLPFAIVWFVHWRSQRHSGLGDRFDLRERLFYISLLAVLAACLIDQGAGLLLHLNGSREAIVIDRTGQFAVVAAFPACLLVLWYLPNRFASIGAGLIVGGVLSAIIDQALFEQIAARPPPSFKVADVTIALGALLLLAGLSLPRAKPERESWSDLRQV